MRHFAWSWQALGVVVLAAVTAVLVVAALSGTGGTAVPGPSPSALSHPPTVSETPTDDPADARPADVEPPLVLVDESTAFRGTTGTCLGGSTLELTTDGAASWRSVKSPANAILQLDAATSAVVNVVGADETCQAATWVSNTAGRVWDGPGATAGQWFRQPDTNRKLQTTIGVVPSPCPDQNDAIVEIDPISATDASLLCSGGEVFRTTNSGTDWTAGSVVNDAVALAWESPDLGWVLEQNTDNCPAFRLSKSIDGGATWQTGGCVGEAAATSPKAARPSLSFADPLIGMANLDGSVATTTDGGLNWTLVRATPQ